LGFAAAVGRVTAERVESSVVEPRIWARPKAGQETCPRCGAGTRRVRRRYRRGLAELAVAADVEAVLFGVEDVLALASVAMSPPGSIREGGR
jgi:hypothetical protein